MIPLSQTREQAIADGKKIFYHAPQVMTKDRQVLSLEIQMLDIQWKANRRIGELLVAKQLINQQQVDNALLLQKSSNKKLGEILIANKLITVGQLQKTLMKQRFIRLVALLTVLFCPVSYAESTGYLLFPVNTIEEQIVLPESSNMLLTYFNSIQQMPQGIAKTYQAVKHAFGSGSHQNQLEQGWHYKLDIIDQEFENGVALQFNYRF
jgi:hypothetical protein